MAHIPDETDSGGPSRTEIIEMMNDEERSAEPCPTCETSHNPNRPCGTQFQEL